MPLDGAWAKEEPGRYLGVGKAVSGEPRDLRLLGCEHIAGFGRSSARLLAGGQPLAAGALGERPHLHGSEHLVSGAQLLASRSAAARSEERRVGEEGGVWGGAGALKKKKKKRTQEAEAGRRSARTRGRSR